MLEYENTKCNFNIVEYNLKYSNTKIEKHTTHSMVQPSPRVFQWNCSHQRLSHLPSMMFCFQSNNSRRRSWRCVWRLDEERCVTTMRWWWSSENWSKTNEWTNEKRNKKLLCPICWVDYGCLEWSNMRIQNAISILYNAININSIQKLKNTQHIPWCNHHLECSNGIAVTSDWHTYLEWCF